MLEATNSWWVNIDNGLLNGVVFIDLKKAFDAIDHEIIVRKMSYFGADHNNLKWFQSYLGNRSQMCNVNGNLSTARTITCDVPQVSILDPLRPIFTYDFCLRLSHAIFIARAARHRKIVYSFYDIKLPVATIVVGF